MAKLLKWPYDFRACVLSPRAWHLGSRGASDGVKKIGDVLEDKVERSAFQRVWVTIARLIVVFIGKCILNWTQCIFRFKFMLWFIFSLVWPVCCSEWFRYRVHIYPITCSAWGRSIQEIFKLIKVLNICRGLWLNTFFQLPVPGKRIDDGKSALHIRFWEEHWWLGFHVFLCGKWFPASSAFAGN